MNEKLLEYCKQEIDSINKKINLSQRKQAHINFLLEEIKYNKIEEQLLNDKVKTKIKEIQDYFKRKFFLIFQMPFGKELNMK